MHLLGDQQRLPNKQRTSAERMFKRINSVIMAVQFCAFLIDLARTSIAAPKTFTSDIWIPSDFALTPLLDAKLANCTYNVTGNVRGFTDIHLSLDASNSSIFLAELAARMRYTLIVAGIALVAGSVNKLIFDLNLFEFRWKQLLMHKEVLSLLELVLLGMTIAGCVDVDETAKLMRDYFRRCGVRGQGSLPFAAPFVPIYVSSAVVLAGHLLSLGFHLWFTLSEKPPKPA